MKSHLSCQETEENNYNMIKSKIYERREEKNILFTCTFHPTTVQLEVKKVSAMKLKLSSEKSILL
jgi:hypothetical protein